ncbi:hypothetical protein CDIK_0690 [Cucumispora dikerogammari]|nr:hypothetical protein CDIK_0690 [Cucumispora dikerogammari]
MLQRLIKLSIALLSVDKDINMIVSSMFEHKLSTHSSLMYFDHKGFLKTNFDSSKMNYRKINKICKGVETLLTFFHKRWNYKYPKLLLGYEKIQKFFSIMQKRVILSKRWFANLFEFLENKKLNFIISSIEIIFNIMYVKNDIIASILAVFSFERDLLFYKIIETKLPSNTEEYRSFFGSMNHSYHPSEEKFF